MKTSFATASFPQTASSRKAFTRSLTILTACLLCLTTTTFAQTDTEQPKSKNGDNSAAQENESENPSKRRSKTGRNNSRFSKEFVAVFSPVAESMESATVQVFSQDEQVALGTIIDASGLVLTKASELKRDLKIKFDDRDLPAKVLGIHPESDLAILQIDSQLVDDVTFSPIKWADEPANKIGQWVVSPKAQSGSNAIGIISTADARPILPSRPFIGITMKDAKQGVRITAIVNDSPADQSGLQINDTIFELDNQPIKNRIELFKALGQYDAGDRISIMVIRFKEEVEIRLTLAEFDKISPSSKRSNQQNSMGSILSRRRKDFPKAIQHDSMLQSNTCGGPILDLSGNAIGINIARAGRVSSLALPYETIRPIIEVLKTGELSPAVVNKEKIMALEQEIELLAIEIEELPEKKSVLNIRFNSERARREELKKSIDHLQARLDEVEENAGDYRKQLNSIRKRMRSGQKTLEQLEAQLDALKTGSSR
jgi:serine protease Do